MDIQRAGSLPPPFLPAMAPQWTLAPPEAAIPTRAGTEAALTFALGLGADPAAAASLAAAREQGQDWCRTSADGAHTARLTFDGWNLLVTGPGHAPLRLRLEGAPTGPTALASHGEDGGEDGGEAGLDIVSRTFFTGAAAVNAPAGLDLGGVILTERQVARLAMAPSGSRVEVTSPMPGLMILESTHPFLIPGTNMTVLVQVPDLPRTVQLTTYSLREQAPAGLGLRASALMVREAAALGFSAIDAYAPVGQGNLNGYYTWPRFGFDAPLTAEDRAALPPSIAGAQTLLDVMASAEGRDWWRAEGHSVQLQFDLAPDSPSQQALALYLREKGARLPL